MTTLLITEERESEAFKVIDAIMNKDPKMDDTWFLTMEDVERIKGDIDKYYEFALYILEAFTPVTNDEKAVYKALSEFMKGLPITEVKAADGDLLCM